MSAERTNPMTAEQLEELMGKVTPGPWWTDAQYDGREMGCSIIAARTDCGPLPGNPTRGMVAWSSAICKTDARRCESNARLIALAPSLARRVIDAEKLVEALRITRERLSRLAHSEFDGVWNDEDFAGLTSASDEALAEWEAAQ